MMTFILSALLAATSYTFAGTSNKKMICQDVEFGAGHFRLVIDDLRDFYRPREERSTVKAEFWIKGEAYLGILENPLFMPDWESESGWYRSSPSPLTFSLCHWKNCPVRKVKLMVHTKDQLKAEGNIKFLLQRSEQERVFYDRQLHCEMK